MPREGHKFSSWSIRSLSTHFNPHAPRGARRRLVVADGRVIKFQSTCPARGTTGGAMVEYTAALPISIHVPREGHDSHKRRQQRSGSHFNPRAPRGARRCEESQRVAKSFNFNPRAPRGARRFIKRGNHKSEINFNPRAPRGARPATAAPAAADNADFNPRAPRGARPHWQAYTAPQSVYFNPRAPRGARLAPLNPVAKDRGISIHVPREGHDLISSSAAR